MRKHEREVTGDPAVLEMLQRCPYLTLAIRTEGAPYCVPLNFGAELAGGLPVVYFHCAKEGAKLEALRACGEVSFAAANMLRVFNKGKAPCGYTTDYESVCASGRAYIVTDEAERLHGLNVLMRHYTGGEFAAEAFDARALSLTTVVKIEVERWTGKRLVRPRNGEEQ